MLTASDKNYFILFYIIGLFKTSWIEGLLSGSIYSIYSTNFFISFENYSGIDAYYPLTILNANIFIFSPLKGYFNAHNSNRITPRDHISDLNEYGLLSTSSGLK